MNEIIKNQIREGRNFLITKWIEALRSGKYVQGKRALRKAAAANTPETWCCLGVLCDVANKELGLGEWVKRKEIPSSQTTLIANDGRYCLKLEHGLHHSYPPSEITKGLDIVATEYLVSCNDTDDDSPKHKNFSQIADYIESEFKKIKP